MYYDLETQNCINIASELPEAAVHLFPKVRRLVMDRISSYESGLLHGPSWVKKRLHEIDKNLQLRWDFNEQCYVVERYVAEQRAHVIVVMWREDGQAKHLDESLFDALREADTWRFSTPQAYLEYKRALAKAKRDENEKQSTEKVLAAVDSLSRRQIDEFIAVERAIHTGETITAHGRDLVTLEQMHDAGRSAMAQGIPIPARRHAINPGMHPRFYKRKNSLDQRIKEGI